MHPENCNHNDKYVSNKLKIQNFLICIFFTAVSFWLLSSWLETLKAAYNSSPVVKLSIGDALGGFMIIGLIIYLWSGFFTVMKTGVQVKFSWSKRKIKVQNGIMLFFFIVSFIVTALTYFIVNERLLSEGYSVKTKYTNMGIYKTYTKNEN
ncbi:hypothetical protein C0W35_18110 [Photobacterium kishitanii]|uniref:chloride channel protein n=1 Tax=Photobacterium kishitanii TaxID=318456 RepID=UPI000D176463|nr:chloride channel protein [Photobacterium kishitanii]PSU89921.1 hypothetical protein C0W35_18110 [Photobacterium kishitanii]